MAMESRARIAGHPVHPLLVTVPLGLFTAAVAFDGLALATGRRRHARTAKAVLGMGLLGGAAAAPPGWIDWFAIPDGTRAKRVGLVHGLGNVALLALMGASYLLRDDDEAPAAAVGLSLAGLALSGVTGWLGGELSYRLGVGVTPGAHLDAPSSLDTSRIAGDERHHAAGGDGSAETGVRTVVDTDGRDITAAEDADDLVDPAA